jgi:hypothetical protein
VPAHRKLSPDTNLPLFASLRSLSELSASALSFLFLKSRLFNRLRPLAPLFAAISALVSFIFSNLQPLFCRPGGWGGIMVNQHGPGPSRTKQTGRMPDTLCARSSMLNHPQRPHSQASSVPRHSVYLTAVCRGETMSKAGPVQRAVSPCRLTNRFHLRGGGHAFTNLT